MQVRNIPASPTVNNNNFRQNTAPAFKAKVVIDSDSFMKCKQNGYKMWTIASNLEPKLKALPDDFEITLKGVKEKFKYLLERLYLAPKEAMKIEIRYLIPVEKIKQMILDIEAENPFLYMRQKKSLLENDPSVLNILKQSTESYEVISKTRDPKEVITKEETKEFQEMIYKKILKMIDEMPDRVINYQRYH